MIYIDRSSEPEPDVLKKKDPESKGLIETQKAIEWYKENPKQKDLFDFKVYKHKSVKEALGNLFHGKCAYCESKYESTSPPDIEHFRPKGAIKINGKLDRPGYYWLAADWDNLLPSCIDCNRGREQELLELEDHNIKVAGKANWFPVKGQHIHRDEKDVHKKDVHTEEECLLLHPCRDEKPEDHLKFVELIRKSELKGVIVDELSEKGMHSIDVFAFNRTGLVDRRKDYWTRVENQAKSVSNQLETLRILDHPVVRDNLTHEIDQLFLYAKEDQEFAGMARQLIKGEVAKFRAYAQDQLSEDLQEFLEEQLKKASEPYAW